MRPLSKAWIAVPLCAAAIVALILGLRAGLDLKSASSELRAEQAKARSEGLLIEPVELASMTAPSQNAATLYRKAIAAWNALPSDRREAIALELDQVIAKGPGPSSHQLLDPLGPACRLAELASERVTCDFERAWTSDVPVPELAQMKLVVRLLCTEALVARRKSLLTAAARAAEHIGQDRTLEAAVYQAEAQRVVIDAIWRFAALDSTPQTQHELSELTSAMSLPSLRNCLAGELALARGRIHWASATTDPNRLDPAVESIRAWSSSPVAQQAFEARLIQAYRRLAATMPSDANDYQGDAEAYRAAMKRIDSDSSASASMNSLLMPNLGAAAEKFQRTFERRRLLLSLLSMPGPSAPVTQIPIDRA